MEILSKLIFGFLCGILYSIGLIFGLNYQEVSVYICIYLYPFLILLSTFSIIYNNIKNIVIKRASLFNFFTLLISIIYSYTYLLIFGCILNHYNYKVYSINSLFNMCYNDLIEISSKLNMSYESVNLFIYCKLFILIILFNSIIIYIINKISDKINKI